MLASDSDIVGRSSALWSEIPTAVLQAELHRRQDVPAKPACGSSGARGTYNTPLHVFALFLILVLSTGACSFPIIVRRFPRLPVPHHFLFLSRHFGTGVLIATAFVHLLPTAFVSLTDPCLPAFWNQGYPAMAGLIAMTAVLVVVGIEMFFATRGAGHIHASEYDTVPDENGHESDKHMGNGHANPKLKRRTSLRPFSQGSLGAEGLGNDTALGALGGPSEQQVWGSSPASVKRTGLANGANHQESDSEGNDSDLDLDELDPTAAASNLLSNPPASTSESTPSSHHRPRPHLRSSSSSTHPPPTTLLSSHHSQQKLLLQCLLLEAGILFHSVFIGIALSVATSTPFVVLLIAISFHQTFEGLALGSRIAAITSFPPSSPKPWLMALAYGTTTPVGQAIGLGVHGLYDPGGKTGLLMVGAMNAISSGLLLFAGLVELLAEDLLSERSYESLRGRMRVEACVAVVAGAMLMALVGAWA